MTIARALFHQCRKAGIALAADGDGILFEAPAGVAVPLDELRACKAELLAVLGGDYLRAAAALVQRVPDPELRVDLAEAFDERAAIAEVDGHLSRGEAMRLAYRDMCRVIDGGRRKGRT